MFSDQALAKLKQIAETLLQEAEKARDQLTQEEKTESDQEEQEETNQNHPENNKGNILKGNIETGESHMRISPNNEDQKKDNNIDTWT